MSAGGLGELTQLLGQLDREKQIHRLNYYEPYPKQIAFHNARGRNGLPANQKLFMAANQIGKTRCGASEVAIHATGRYPDWWTGIRFPGAIKILVSGVTNELTRDKPQAELLGPPEDDKQLGTGMLPIECIGRVTRKAGVPNAIDTVLVKHISGRWSRIYFRPYEAGGAKFQSQDYQVVWADEEPDAAIWSQMQRSTFAQKLYVILITATPEKGMTLVVSQFMNDLQDNQALVTATWDDAKHMTPDMRAEKLKTIPRHERDMRTKGLPLAGAGLIFPYQDEEFVIDPIKIQPWFARIRALDYGHTHPFAAVDLAWDRDMDCIYLTRDYRAQTELPYAHCAAVKAWGDCDWIPWAWPHDGQGAEKGTGKQLKVYYREQGLQLLPNHATNPPEPGLEEGKGGIGIEPGLTEMCMRIETGRFKVFSTCTAWIEEKRMYHREIDGKIVKLQDDTISASRYGIMMRRFARTPPAPARRHQTFHGLRNWGT